MQKPLTPEQAQEAADAYINHGRNGLQAAQALGLPRSTFDNRLRLAKRLGLIPDNPGPGFEIKQESVRYNADGQEIGRTVTSKPEAGEEFKVPEGYSIKGESALVGPDGRVNAKWIKTDRDAARGEALVEAIRASVKSLKPHPPVEAPIGLSKKLLNVYPLADCHINMYANAEESGRPYNLQIAKKYIIGNMEKMMDRCAPAHTACILLAGDALHNNDCSNRTPKSGHVLDVAGRYSEAVRCASDIILALVSMSLHRHRQTVVRVIAGNHDEASFLALSSAVYGAYRDSKRVTVDFSDNPIFLYEHGVSMISGIHGHACKPEKIESFMSNEDPKMWGRTTHRYAFSGHLHNEEYKTIGSVQAFRVAPVAPRDGYATAMGYSARHGFSAYTFCAKDGLTDGAYRMFPARVAA